MNSVDWESIDRWLVGESWVESRLEDHLAELCVNIGPRWASSQGERRAAEYISRWMEASGLSDAKLEEFEFDTWDYSSATANLLPDRLAINILPYQFCPPFVAEGPIVDVGFGAMHEQERVRDRLRGAIAVISMADEPSRPRGTTPSGCRT